MNRPVAAVFAISIASLLSGCASTRQFSPVATGSSDSPSDPNLARIYVLRPGTFVGGAVSFKIQEGNKVVGKIGPAGCLCWERPPGEVRLVDPNITYRPLRFEAEKGRTYFVEWSISMFDPSPRMTLLSEEAGRETLKKCTRKPKTPAS